MVGAYVTSHNKSQIRVRLQKLEQRGAPPEVSAYFLEIINRDEQLAVDGKLESLDVLLREACCRVGFSAAFDDGVYKRWLRPTTCSQDSDAYRRDASPTLAEFNPVAEQAYRRGYHEGFGDAVDRISRGAMMSSLDEELAKLLDWRRSPIYFGPTAPGLAENWEITISRRRKISPTIRYNVLERSKNRCVACGATAADAMLQVDHIIAIANGGSNDITNLQALCEECNLGKGAR